MKEWARQHKQERDLVTQFGFSKAKDTDSAVVDTRPKVVPPTPSGVEASSDEESGDSARSPRKRRQASSTASRSHSPEWDGTAKYSTQSNNLYADAHQQAQHAGIEKHRRALPPNVPAKSFSKIDDTQTHQQNTDGNCVAVGRFDPLLNLAQQKNPMPCCGVFAFSKSCPPCVWHPQGCPSIGSFRKNLY